MVSFKQIKRGGYLPDLIASEIMAQVTSGDLAPGDKLPTETALAESFGVSRNVVREAIARLRSDGVVDTKPGRGACILPPNRRASFRVDANFLNEARRLESLFELRGLLEVDAAGLAAERRSDKDLADLQAAMNEMDGQGAFDDQRVAADGLFHRALARATQNEYLAAIIDYLAVRIIETTQATSEVYTSDDLLEITINEHGEILAAVRDQKPILAREAMARHIQRAADRLEVNLNLRDAKRGDGA